MRHMFPWPTDKNIQMSNMLFLWKLKFLAKGGKRKRLLVVRNKRVHVNSRHCSGGKTCKLTTVRKATR